MRCNEGPRVREPGTFEGYQFMLSGKASRGVEKSFRSFGNARKDFADFQRANGSDLT